MPENTDAGFIAWRRWIQSVANAAGLGCSKRAADRLVMPVATHFGLVDNGLPLRPPHGDPTGELVVTAALKGVRVTDLLARAAA